MRYLILSSSFLLFFFLSDHCFSQVTLQEKYEQLLDRTETFKEYKVIPSASLNQFWLEAQDSLVKNAGQIVRMRAMISVQQDTILSLRGKNQEQKAELDESLMLNDSIQFMGVRFSEFSYHLLVWSIIIVLTVLGLLAYFMFLTGNKVTSRTKREIESLNAEFEDHKAKARETQVKLKRELQTAVNTLNERR